MHDNENQSRRKFVAWGAGALAIVGGFGWFARKKKEKPTTTKMLTQDGRLVEVDVKMLSQVKKKASTKDVQDWVKR